MRGAWIGLIVLLITASAANASTIRASLLPLDAQRADTLRSGRVEVSLGMTYAKNERFPYFTVPGGLRSQDRLEVPEVGFRVGAGDWAEIEAAYELIYLDEITSRGQTNWQYGSGDARLHTKVRVLHEDTWPGLAVRFGAKLPNANRGSRLGTDDTDFDMSAIASKDLGAATLHVNLGILLLGNSGPFLGSTFHAGGQDDLFTYDVAVESAPMGAAGEQATQLRALAEINGHTGSRFDNERSHALVGIRLERGTGALYLGASAGFDSGSEDIGARVGILYSFEPSSWFDSE